MSLVLEFRISQNPEASSAGIGTNRRFPPIAPLTGATEREASYTIQQEAQAALGMAPARMTQKSHTRQPAPIGFTIP
jgi:hypothetical protein